MRQITGIIVHCADTPPDMDIGVEEIREWHLARGWYDIGYHYVIRRNGAVEVGRGLDAPGAHVHGHNSLTIGICLAGGKGSQPLDEPAEHFSHQQLTSLGKLIKALQIVFPELKVVRGHNDYTEGKACPGFKVAEWWEEWLTRRAPR